MAKIGKMADDQIKTLRRRNIYLSARIPEIKKELAALEDERKSVVAKANAKVGSEDQLRENNHRRIYLVTRLDILRGEQKQLIAERKDLTDKLKDART